MTARTLRVYGGIMLALLLVISLLAGNLLVNDPIDYVVALVVIGVVTFLVMRETKGQRQVRLAREQLNERMARERTKVAAAAARLARTT